MTIPAEAAIEILRATSDGDDLDPLDLRLVEATLNGGVDERGEVAFYELLARVRGGYRPPWFHGIEGLTIDHIGHVRWRGKEVEHYDQPWEFSAGGEAVARELARCCRHLETVGQPVNTTTAVWRWADFAPSRPDGLPT